jgi:hypothetical protein
MSATLVQLVQAADLGIKSVRLDEEALDPAEIHILLDRATTKAPATTAKKAQSPTMTTKAPAEHTVMWAEFRDRLENLGYLGLRTPGVLRFDHQGRVDSKLGYADESRGTRVWFDLLGLAINALTKGWTLAVDEIDSGLHPLLLQQFVQLFRNEHSNSSGAQLIFTTHDVTLLGRRSGEELLARDEVWFVEKDLETGASSLFPLSDFRPREGLNWERRYLGGALGAVPYIDQHEFVLGSEEESESSAGE